MQDQLFDTAAIKRFSDYGQKQQTPRITGIQTGRPPKTGFPL
jgi:hypothetical protein